MDHDKRIVKAKGLPIAKAERKVWIHPLITGD
jgi:hypothetical protein